MKYSVNYLTKRGKHVKIVLVVKFKAIVRCSSPHKQQREGVSFASDSHHAALMLFALPQAALCQAERYRYLEPNLFTVWSKRSLNLHLLISFSLKKCVELVNSSPASSELHSWSRRGLKLLIQALTVIFL